MQRNGYHYYDPPIQAIKEIQMITEPIATNIFTNFRYKIKFCQR